MSDPTDLPLTPETLLAVIQVGDLAERRRNDYHTKYEEALAEQQEIRAALRRAAGKVLGRPYTKPYSDPDRRTHFKKTDKVHLSRYGVVLFEGRETEVGTKAEAIVVAYLLTMGLSEYDAVRGAAL